MNICSLISVIFYNQEHSLRFDQHERLCPLYSFKIMKMTTLVTTVRFIFRETMLAKFYKMVMNAINKEFLYFKILNTHSLL